MTKGLCRSAAWLLATSAIVAAAPAWAQSAREFDIPAQSMAGALEAFARQSGAEVMFDRAQVASLRSMAVRGRLSADKALARLTTGSGLSIQQPTATTFVVRLNSTAGVLADAAELQEIVVTGTRIIGASLASPVTVVTDAQIRTEGHLDLGQLARSLPINYSGGQNPGVRFGVGGSNNNYTGGSSFNLRGLGPDATLTLLNGHRLAYNGANQAVDISIIPIDALSSVQIVPDGASAVYGSDAVAGVANIILKPDFEGLSTTARFGQATSGGGELQSYELVTGQRWSSGGLMIAGKFAQQEPITSSQRSYTRFLPAPNFLNDFSRQHSVLGTLHQDLGSKVELKVDATYNSRALKIAQQSTATMAYRYRNNNVARALAPSLTVQLGKDWSAEASGFIGSDGTTSYSQRQTRATGAIAQSPSTYRNGSHGAELSAQGPLFRLPGGDVRLAVGAGYRYNEYTFRTPTILWVDDEAARYAYGELFAPLVSEVNTKPMVRQLSVTGAVRHENYDDFGKVTTPKLGVVYAPADDLVLKASWGRSFKAPTLEQTGADYNVQILPMSYMGVPAAPTATFFSMGGGNADLRPERARTLSLSAAYQPSSIPGLQADLAWYDIDYKGRVVRPLNPFLAALTDPIFAEYIDYNPTVEKLNALIARSPGGLINLTGRPYNPADVYAIGQSTLINAARQKISGVDLGVRYAFDAFGGKLTLNGSASWLDLKQQNNAAAKSIELSGLLYNPPAFRARLGAVWSSDALTLTGFYNHIGEVDDNRTVPAIAGDEMQTFDAGATYRIGDRGRGLAGTEVSVFVQNLTNEAPPLLANAPLSSVNFDHTNYSAVGRFISVQLRRQW